jgi:hypothetical protein
MQPPANPALKKPPPSIRQHPAAVLAPLTKCMKALADQDPLELDASESLPEMEREIGMADWIDPETGEPAEGLSPPHLDAEQGSRQQHACASPRSDGAKPISKEPHP